MASTQKGMRFRVEELPAVGRRVKHYLVSILGDNGVLIQNPKQYANARNAFDGVNSFAKASAQMWGVPFDPTKIAYTKDSLKPEVKADKPAKSEA